jgi:hypothetical protein
MTDNNKDDELAALKARVEELERAAKPPAPFDPGPYQRYDPTEGMSMPASVVREMARAVPTGMIQDIAMRDNRAPTGPSAQGVIPSSQGVSNVRTGGGGVAHTVPLGPPPGVNILDRIMDHEDAKDQHARMVEEAKRQAMLK